MQSRDRERDQMSHILTATPAECIKCGHYPSGALGDDPRKYMKKQTVTAAIPAATGWHCFCSPIGSKGSCGVAFDQETTEGK